MVRRSRSARAALLVTAAALVAVVGSTLGTTSAAAAGGPSVGAERAADAATAPLPAPAADAAEQARAEHQRILDYWTDDRVRGAKPRAMGLADDGTFVALATAAGTITPSVVSGSTWTGGGVVQTTTGRVFFSVGSGNWFCSGSTVSDGTAGRSIVLTAAHCAYDLPTQAFVTNWVFVPDWSTKPTIDTFGRPICASTSKGCWTASSLVISKLFAGAGFALNTTAVQYDYAFAVVGQGGLAGTTQLDSLGGLTPPSMVFSGQSSGTSTYDFGYPAESPYNGDSLTYCQNSLSFDAAIKNVTYQLGGCPLNGGSSGGPWFKSFASGTGTIFSVNSYCKVKAGTQICDGTAIYGPKFSSTTSSLFTKAKTATANTKV